jgi:hypothetical protein
VDVVDPKLQFGGVGERSSRHRVRNNLPGSPSFCPLVIGDSSFVQLGLRDAGGFIGRRERDTGAPLPEHISARHEDLPELIEGLVAFGSEPFGELDPVIVAACLAFGFVYIHPFEDGNGRIHRYLIHHVLAEQSFNPPELVFPVSSVMLREIDIYRSVLETHSRAILPFIKWRATDQRNVEVLDDTADFYRFFDATPHAEFLYHCVEETIEKDLPQETGFRLRSAGPHPAFAISSLLSTTVHDPVLPQRRGPRALPSGGSNLVRAALSRRSDRAPGAGLAGDPEGRGYADRRAHRHRQDALRVPRLHRSPLP